MEAPPHLSTMLSQVLVAYTIEADYEFESGMPHRTAFSRASGEPSSGPLLISLAQWANFLSLVPEEGISVSDLSERSGLRQLETSGMTRWGYVTIVDKFVRQTSAGTQAAAVWQPVEDRIEQRWRERFGATAVDALRSSIAAATSDLPEVGPNYLPSVQHGLWTVRQLRSDRDPALQASTLSAVLSRTLTVLAVAFERSSELSLAISANALRVLEPGIAVREVARRAGIANEITEVSLGYLAKRGFAALSSDGRTKTASPTQAAAASREFTEARLTELDRRFEGCREPLNLILDNIPALSEGLEPHPTSWRARPPYLAQTERILANPRTALPHFPIVTHRGGYPDGS